MALPEVFEIIRPSVIAFISRVTIGPPNQAPPLFPSIIGTGFFVHSRGIAATNRHVVDALEKLAKLPTHPITGASAVGALVFTEIQSTGSERAVGMLNLDVRGWNALEQFTVGGPWFGQAVPDLAFVQLAAREVPALRVTGEPNVLRAGQAIATAGFPEGSSTVTFHEKITQLTPVLRHGIISSVFPFAGPSPHGFSIDTLLQGGASGSPVFKTDEPVVVGMIASQISNTNFTVCVPSNVLEEALRSALTVWPEFEGVPRLVDLIESGEKSAEETLRWDEYPAT